MLGLIDYLIIGAITNSGGNVVNCAPGQKQLSNFERNIENIKTELGPKFQDNFLEPMIVLGLAGAFVHGIDGEKAREAKADTDKLKNSDLKSSMKKLIDKQPMQFDELKRYLNMVNPHYYHVLDYVLWNTMTSPEDLTSQQKQLMKNWRDYQKSRLNFD